MMHPHIAAQGLASLGRKGDSTLVHMSPGEVAGLQKIAMAHGGSLTINPHTGLAEAGFLSSILPMIGGALTAVFAPELLPYEAAATGLIAKASGDTWGQSVMAGLSAYGGGSLAEGLGAAGATASAATPVADAAAPAAPAATDTATTAAPAVADTATAAAPGVNATINSGLTTGADGSGLTQGMTDEMKRQFLQANNFSLDNTANGLTKSFTLPENSAGVTNAAYGQLSPSTLQSMKAAYANGSWAPDASTAGSNISKGIGTLNTGAGWSNLGSTMGKTGVMAVAAPVAQMAMNAGKSSNIPAATAQNEYYIQAPGGKPLFSPGTVNPNIAKLGYLPAGQEAFTGQGFNPGVYSQSPTQYIPVAATPGQAVITGADGGIMSLKRPKKFDAGGSTVSNATGQEMLGALPQFHPAQGQDSAALSNMNQYFQNMGNQASAQPPQQMLQPTPSPGAMNDYLAQTNQIITPPPVQPRQPIVHPTAPTPAPSAPAIGTTGIPGLGSLARGISTPSYTWDPTTNSWVEGPGTTTGGGPVGGKAAGGGIAALSHGGSPPGTYAAGGKLLRGPGDGMSDSIPAVIHGKNPQRAALADGEFVVPADVVSHLGNGSTEAGSRKLYSMMDKVRRARTGNPKQGKQINPDKFMPA